jgi:hypothetical protein
MKQVKIYCIEDINDLKYIGSTTQSLNQRLNKHRFQKRCDNHITSKKLNLYNCIVYELETCDEYDRDERERYWILNTDCVNFHIPGGQSEEQLREKKKIYTDKNKEKKREYDKQRRILQKEKLKKQKEEYRNKPENKLRQQEYMKEYMRKNKEKKREYDKQRRILQKENRTGFGI